METKKGNLLDLEKGFIVHGCNAQGAMGSGIALQIRHKWPIVYNDYRVRYLLGHCNDKGQKLKWATLFRSR